jgi:hypothetical protein
MNGLRAVHSTCRGCGLLLGLLLALGPVLQLVAAAQGPCGRAPESEPAPVTVEALLGPAAGAQWTCPDQEPVSAIRALPSDRPDGPAGGGGASLDGEEESHHTPSQRMGPVPVHLSISPILAALRPIVLQI